MRIPTVACFLLMDVVSVQASAGQRGDFLRKVSVREVEAELQTTLNDLLSGTSAATKRFATIEASTWQSFQALPKNAVGRLAPPAVRYIVRGYFAKEHGWLINGLESHGMQSGSTDVHEVNILQDKAPLLVETLLEARQGDRGLAFNDVVAMIAVLEQMMFDESVTLLQAAYRLNGVRLEMQIDEAMLHRVLQSYLILFGQGSKANLEDADRHQAQLEKARNRREIQEFEHDAVLNFEYARRHRANPFQHRQYSFQAAAEIMDNLAQNYGKWQNSECRDMKAHLKELDPEGLGRVPLSLFYAQPNQSSYHFTESADYLQKIGALDETTPSNPQVYIANYVSGPSNCIASSSYYSVCCLSECDELMGDLERHIAAPLAPPETLLALVTNISHQVVDGSLSERLHVIAARHGGNVPLHGRLFAQWLHFAFPHECPYPSILESATALSASQWLGGRSTASVEEREKHLTSAPTVYVPTAEDIDIDGRWSDHEVLPVHTDSQAKALQQGAGVVRVIVQLVALVLVMRSALAAWRTVGIMSDSKSKKDDDFVLGVRV